MQIEWRCFRKPTTWRVIGNFEGGEGGSQRPNLFRGGSKAALVFQTGGAKVKKKSSVGEVRITHILHGEGITHSFLRFCLTVQMKPMYNIVSGGSRGGARGARPPYFKTKLKGWIIFFGDQLLPSPHPLSQGLNPALVVTQSHGTCILFFLVYRKWILLGLYSCVIHPFYTLGSYCNRNLKGSTGIIFCRNTVIQLYLWIGRSELARLTCKILREALVLIPTLRTNIWLQICEPDLQNIRLLLCAYM